MRGGPDASTSALPDIFKAYDIRGLYGEQIDGDLAERIGRAFPVVLSSSPASRPARCGSASAATCGSRRRSWRAATATGSSPRASHVVDAGMVGTEMLYWLVGSRELDGGLMCTASHNPKAYTGVKLVREGAIALSGDSGIQDVRRAGRRRALGAGRPAAARSKSSTSTAPSRRRRCASSTPTRCAPSGR